ncbi:MAG: hypothetical protein PHE47_01675 [Oscillospiraceae bacterium]|nr:hypothetical protein [Oscillospiraceae bacterium]
MDRRTGDEWSGDPLLRDALWLYMEQMLGELPCERELSAKYQNTPRLDQMIGRLEGLLWQRQHKE